MLQAFVLTFREGLGAFLVVAVMLAFFHRAGRPRLVRAVRWAIAASALASGIAGALFSTADDQASWEGAMAMVAAMGVAGLAAYLWRLSTSDAHGNERWPVLIATFVVTVLLIVRGGMEIALLLGTMVIQVRASAVILGSMFGGALAISVAWLWSQYGRRLDLVRIQQVTAIFLVVFFAYLIVDGVHELAEANTFAGAETLHAATEAFSSDGVYGQYAAYLLIVVPVAWLLATIFFGHGKASDGRVAHVGR